MSGLSACSWTGSDFSVAVATSGKGISSANGQAVPGTKHKAMQTTDTGGFGGCGVFVEASASTTVLVIAVLNGSRPVEEACTKAVAAAKIVDTTLP